MSANPTKGLIRWFWRGYLAPYWPMLAVALVLMAVEGASLGVFAAMMQPMFDDIFVAGQSSALWFVGLVVMGIFVLRAITSMGQRVILTKVSEQSSAQMRRGLMDHLMQLDLAFHQRNPPGALIERVQGDVAAIGKIWAGIITGLGRDLTSVIALFGVALFIDWRWTLVALIGIPVLLLPSLLVQRYVRGRARTAREVSARMATRLDEVFHGVAQVKLNGLERYQSARYGVLVDTRVDAEVRAATGQAAIPGLIDIMTGLGFLCVLIYGGGEIISGDKTPGQFMAFFTSMSLAFEPLRRLGNISGLWQAAAASIERMRDIFETKPQITSPARALPAPQGAPEIRLDNVSLAYANLPVLRGVSFVAEAGKTTALVGASGAGKSSVFNILTRLVDPGSGQATIGGTPVTAMSLADLRAMFSVVTQETLLFDDSLRENILLGADANADNLAAALKAAHIDDFLPQLAQGLDTQAGPRGSALSGGQRQRVAIARAVLRDRPILLLDEATSALDTKSETAIQAALDKLSKGRTTLVIAHRLSTIRRADSIIVMDKGQVADQGSHEELLARGGLYAELYRLQFSDMNGEQNE